MQIHHFITLLSLYDVFNCFISFPQEEVHTQLKDDDGAFWMSFEDFLENFYSINVCMVKPPKGTPGNGRWFETRERFNYTMTDGGGDEGRIVSAPSYVLTVRDRNEHVYVSVHQKDTRCVGSGPYVDIGVTVLKFNDATQKYDLIGSTGNSSDRQNQTESMCLEPGQYLVLPTSTGCKLRLVRSVIQFYFLRSVS